MSDNADELKHILNRIWHALSHNPEGLNLIDLQKLCEPYKAPLHTNTPCKHIYPIITIGSNLCIRCGEPRKENESGTQEDIG